MAIISVPRVLREKLGEDGADALVGLINEADGQAKGDVLTFVEEKFERRLSEEIAKVNERITTEVAKLHETITVEVGKVNERITTEVAGLRETITVGVGKVNERITTEAANLRDTITREIGKVNDRITGVEARLDVGMARLRAELIRWMFLFWVGQVGLILGVLFVFFRR